MPASVPIGLVRRAALNYFSKRPYCASFELTHNCNARCRHCHRGAVVPGETVATPQRLLEVCRQLRPVVANLSGGEPLLRRDLAEVVQTLKRGCAPLRILLNTNGSLLTPARLGELRDAGVDEFLISLDYPDARHDEHSGILGLFDHIRSLIGRLDPADRRNVVLTSVLQSDNFMLAPDLAALALEWDVNINFSAYTRLRTHERALAIQPQQLVAFREVVERLIERRRAHGNILTSDWVLREMVRFFEEGRLPGCRAGERSLVVNPDGTLSPCGVHVRDYATQAELKRHFTARNICGDCFTSTRGNSERPARRLFLDHLGYLARHSGH